MRVKAVIAYDGSHFFGFQKQTHTPYTVATQIEKSLQNIGIDSPIIASGRTDTGVHATGQVIHFDLPKHWRDTTKLAFELNRKLEHIHIKHITATDATFHARFSAKKRLYRYIFKTKSPSVFEKNYIASYPSFDLPTLKSALQCFEGTHDFATFHKKGSQTNTTVRTLYRAYYKPYHDYHILYFLANGFLRSQVRMMVESAMSCATHKMPLASITNQLNGNTPLHKHLAPPQGLYLARVIY